MYHAYHPGAIPAENGSALQATYAQKQQEWLVRLNAAPNILYYQDMASHFPDKSIEALNETRAKQLASFEIEAMGNVNPSYIYKGDNPSQALDHLLQVEPCYLECGGALVLASYLALRDTIGPSAFNQLIKTMHDGVLKIKNAHFPPFYKRTYYARTFEEIQKTGAALNFNSNDFKPGTFAHIVGSPYGFSIHPASELNGYNVLWTKPDSFLGFSSTPDPAASQVFYFELLNKAFHRNLTYQDVLYIDQLNKIKPNEYALYSPYTYRQTYDLLMSEFSAQMTEALEKLASGSVKAYDQTSISVPASMRTMPMVGAHAFTEIDPRQFLMYISLDKASLKAEREKTKSNYIVKNSPLPLYDQQDVYAPQKTYAEITYFLAQTPERMRNKQAGGLMIQGKFGIDVEQGCDDAMKMLATQHRVLKVPELDVEFHEKMMRQIENNHGKLDAFVVAMSRTWNNYDVFYIDEVNGDPTSSKTLLAKALFIYCKRHQKQLLITGEADFFKLFPVYDQQLSWMRNLKIEPKPTPLSPSKKK